MATAATSPVDEILPAPKLFALGLQHVLVMYAGAIAVPLIIGRVLKLAPEDVAFLISADLFVCGIVSILQSFGLTRWFGIKLPVMMDDLVQRTGLSAAALSSRLLMLEVDARIERLPGNGYQLLPTARAVG
jgi:NCS2 family nucleobase:cation symporter-2